ncbi:hypothetical protein GCM10019016_070930 [Streptomyces prasinosporus]|uniref:Uncharacterized protein n=1 Tax=Streptomyces prasinosporus TaxID=68256 RepID=A0ABP6TZ49_9ACTN
MPATAPRPHSPRPAAEAHARITALLADLRAGTWTPTPLETRIAGLLVTATAGAGLLTSHHVRTALWEGHLALTRANDGRFARALAGLLPVLDDPRPAAGDVLADTGRLLAAVTAR